MRHVAFVVTSGPLTVTDPFGISDHTSGSLMCDFPQPPGFNSTQKVRQFIKQARILPAQFMLHFSVNRSQKPSKDELPYYMKGLLSYVSILTLRRVVWSTLFTLDQGKQCFKFVHVCLYGTSCYVVKRFNFLRWRKKKDPVP